MSPTVAQRTKTGGPDYFQPGDYVIDIIRRAVANQQCIRVHSEGRGTLLLLPKRGEYIAEFADPAQFFTTAARQFQVDVLETEPAALPRGAAHGRNIDELMWNAAFHASDGRLMDGCRRDDVVQFRHWPNLTRLPVTPNTTRIVALLTRHPTSITLARHLLKVDAAEMYQIYSAAQCAGIAHVLNRKPDDPVLKPHRNQALLGMLLNKIAGL
jgi:hypothetical protein